MWRHSRTIIIMFVSFAIPTWTAGAAQAGDGCRYWVKLSREALPGENVARTCDVLDILSWLAGRKDVSAPETALNDGFTVTIGSMRGPTEALPPLPGIGHVLLTERVYPLAASGPVAFILSTSIIRTGPHHRVVVPEGWRSLDAIAPVPSVLAGLGMLQPAPSRSTPNVTPTPTEPATGSGRPGPDLVTVLFLLAILTSIGVVVRRSIGRTRQDVGDDLAHNPESHPGHG
jgi:hypothetical protein